MYQDTQKVDAGIDLNDILTNDTIKQETTGKVKKLGQRLLHTKYLLLQARQIKRNTLLMLHAMTFDRKFEKLLFIPSEGSAREIELVFDQANDEEGSSSDRVPVKSVKWALDIIPRDEQGITFVDSHAGRGQRLLIAAARPFEKIIGMERSTSLRDDANMNIAQFPRSYMRCRQVECGTEAVEDFPVPEGRAVYLFHKPRHMADFQKQLDKITAEYKRQPRRFHILTLGASPQVQEKILQTGIFERASYSKVSRVKHRLFSPYRIKAYKTLV